MPPKSRRSLPRSLGTSPSTTPTPLPRGFYSRLLSRLDLADLETSNPSGLAAEIELMRVFIRRLVEKGTRARSLTATLRIVRALTLANSSLDRLVKTQEKHFGPGKEISQAVSAALEELRQEGFIHPPGSSCSPDPDNENTA